VRTSANSMAPGRKSALKITNLSTGLLTLGAPDPPTDGGQETSLCMHRPYRQQPLTRGGWIDLLDDPEPQDEAEAQVLFNRPPPGIARFAVYCDESGTHDARYYGFGSLWMPYQRRGEFAALMKAIRSRLRYGSEFKWHKVRSENQAEYLELVEMFIAKSWLSFHMLLVEKAWVDLALHNGDPDLARQKHFTQFLSNKILRCVRRHEGQDTQFRVYVDHPLVGSAYAKAHEASQVIGNHYLQRELDLRPIDKVIPCDSKQRNGIQLCDLLLGAVMDSWNADSESAAKGSVRDRIASHLGWDDLRADTNPKERKFNIWYLQHPKQRVVQTRAVLLRNPLPPIRRYQSGTRR
jgi:hypothetical protein